MDFFANEEKSVDIETPMGVYMRHAVKTKFITPGCSYIEVLKEYVLPIYKEGDIVSIGEKIISLCQGRIIRREDIKIGAAARFLSRFACGKDRGGYGVGLPINMQYAIDKKGLLRILSACALGGAFKLFGVRGVFYKVAGREVAGLDGFYDGAFLQYRDIGIELPASPRGVCREIKDKLGISCMIVDANDFGCVILGKSDDIKLSRRKLCSLIRDNPAGQGTQQTPIILIRKA